MKKTNYILLAVITIIAAMFMTGCSNNNKEGIPPLPTEAPTGAATNYTNGIEYDSQPTTNNTINKSISVSDNSLYAVYRVPSFGSYAFPASSIAGSYPHSTPSYTILNTKYPITIYINADEITNSAAKSNFTQAGNKTVVVQAFKYNSAIKNWSNESGIIPLNINYQVCETNQYCNGFTAIKKEIINGQCREVTTDCWSQGKFCNNGTCAFSIYKLNRVICKGGATYLVGQGNNNTHSWNTTSRCYTNDIRYSCVDMTDGDVATKIGCEPGRTCANGVCLATSCDPGQCFWGNEGTCQGTTCVPAQEGNAICLNDMMYIGAINKTYNDKNGDGLGWLVAGYGENSTYCYKNTIFTCNNSRAANGVFATATPCPNGCNAITGICNTTNTYPLGLSCSGITLFNNTGTTLQNYSSTGGRCLNDTHFQYCNSTSAVSTKTCMPCVMNDNICLTAPN